MNSLYEPCVLCNSTLELIYTPKHSKIGLEILICQICGFVQSAKNIDSAIVTPAVKFDHLSCDSDYSMVRVGKQQMTQKDIEILNTKSDLFEQNWNILDAASARGHFVEWALLNSNQKVYCCESDTYLSKNYAKLERVQLSNLDFRDTLFETIFDFIYSCHTLEHYKNPRIFLDKASALLRNDGYLYLNVPNLDGIESNFALDDFFYDHHRVYFDFDTLQYLLFSTGFEIVETWNDTSCLRILAKKNIKNDSFGFPQLPTRYASNSKLIAKYSKILLESREKLPSVVNTMYGLCDLSKPLIAVGCGRMFDAFLVYGGMQLDAMHYLVDNFISIATSSIYGRPVMSLNSLPDVGRKGNFLIFSRSSGNEISKEILARFPKANIIHLSDFMGSPVTNL